MPNDNSEYKILTGKSFTYEECVFISDETVFYALFGLNNDPIASIMTNKNSMCFVFNKETIASSMQAIASGKEIEMSLTRFLKARLAWKASITLMKASMFLG